MSMTRSPGRAVIAAVAVSAATLVLASCGSTENRGSGGGGGGGSVSPEASSLVEEHASNPTSVGYDEPLSKPAPAGKRIVALQVAVDVAKVENEAMEKAAELLGWDFERIVVGTGPEDPAKALEQAIDSKPDGIYYSGFQTSAMQEQLDRAQSEGIPVFTEALGDTTPAASFAQIRNTPTVERLGQLTGAWVASDSGGDAHVIVVDAPAFPILTAYSNSVKQSVEDYCDGCDVEIMNANVADIGTTLPSQIVSELQRSPDVNYLVFSFGDLTAGLNAALAAAGEADQVKIAGQLPGLENVASLKSGENDMWVPELSPLIGWRVMDSFARQFVGDDPDVAADGSPTPTQVLTPDNVEGAVFDDSGYWVGVSDYESVFGEMWHVG